MHSVGRGGVCLIEYIMAFVGCWLLACIVYIYHFCLGWLDGSVRGFSIFAFTKEPKMDRAMISLMKAVVEVHPLPRLN